MSKYNVVQKAGAELDMSEQIACISGHARSIIMKNNYNSNTNLLLFYPDQACKKTCYQKHIMQECGCADRDYPFEGPAFNNLTQKVELVLSQSGKAMVCSKVTNGSEYMYCTYIYCQVRSDPLQTLKQK